MYETGTTAGVRAYHLMPGMPPPEGERHAHDYRLDVVVRRAELDEHGMVVDLDLLASALHHEVEHLAGADLDETLTVEPDDSPVTVEVFARWLHGRLAAALRPAPALTLSVRVWESPIAFGGYTAPVDGPASSA